MLPPNSLPKGRVGVGLISDRNPEELLQLIQELDSFLQMSFSDRNPKELLQQRQVEVTAQFVMFQ
jgi:hypothetical protein